jgi:hypothetical protein
VPPRPRPHRSRAGPGHRGKADDRPYAPGSVVEFPFAEVLALSLEGEATALAQACHSFLDHVQDYIAETTGEPWPAASSPMPVPQVVVTESDVVLGFHVGGEPVLVVESLPR